MRVYCEQALNDLDYQLTKGRNRRVAGKLTFDAESWVLWHHAMNGLVAANPEVQTVKIRSKLEKIYMYGYPHWKHGHPIFPLIFLWIALALWGSMQTSYWLQPSRSHLLYRYRITYEANIKRLQTVPLQSRENRIVGTVHIVVVVW